MESKAITRNAIFLILDVIPLFIDGFFHKALKESSTSILSKDEADELKAPVLAFVVLATIANLMNIVVILGFTFKEHIRYDYVKRKWPFITSGLFAWFVDFPQIVIALTVAFELKDGLIGSVQFVKPVFGLVKAILQICSLTFFQSDKTPYAQLVDNDRNDEEMHSDIRRRLCNIFTLWFTYTGNITNLICSFILLVRVSKFM